jgi:hypothetical protein
VLIRCSNNNNFRAKVRFWHFLNSVINGQQQIDGGWVTPVPLIMAHRELIVPSSHLPRHANKDGESIVYHNMNNWIWFGFPSLVISIDIDTKREVVADKTQSIIRQSRRACYSIHVLFHVLSVFLYTTSSAHLFKIDIVRNTDTLNNSSGITLFRQTPCHFNIHAAKNLTKSVKA